MLPRYELEKAVKENSVERMMEAIAKGASVEDRGYGDEPLLYVAMKVKKPGALEAGRKLIELGADVNERVGCDKDTLLIKAARTGNAGFLWLLLKNKADFTLGNRFGKTALAYCVDTDYMARDLRNAGCYTKVGSRYAQEAVNSR
jgi:ankyrin repeat protein